MNFVVVKGRITDNGGCGDPSCCGVFRIGSEDSRHATAVEAFDALKEAEAFDARHGSWDDHTEFFVLNTETGLVWDTTDKQWTQPGDDQEFFISHI